MPARAGLRRYVRSRSHVQLAKAEGDPETHYCDPLEYYAGDSSRPIDPCGLTAWTYFNDSYTVCVCVCVRIRTAVGGCGYVLEFVRMCVRVCVGGVPLCVCLNLRTSLCKRALAQKHVCALV